MLLKPLFRLLIPLVLLIAALYLRERLSPIRGVYQALLVWLPYVALCSALLISAFYNRARLFTVILSLLLAYWLISTQLQVSLSAPLPSLIYSLLSLILPLLFLLLILIPEKGMGSLQSWWIVASVPAAVLVGWLIWLYEPDFSATIHQLMPILPVKGYFLSTVASSGFLLCFLVGIVVLIKRNSEHVAAVLSALIAVFITLAFLNKTNISIFMLTAAGIALIISLLRSAHEMAYRDDLTGLLGRRALNERFASLGRSYVLAMLDVDHFKKFNDTYGHDVGDDVLKMVAMQINRVKGGGKAYRYGGEEFCILFPRKDLEVCLPYLEAVRLAIEDYKLSLRDIKTRPSSAKVGRQQRGYSRKAKTVSVTISIGIAERNEKHYEPEDVLKAADQALYRAKKKGRNCIAY